MVRTGRRLLALTLLVLAVLGQNARPAGAHPLHTTLTALGYDPAKREVTLTVRVFADDFGRAAARSRSPLRYLNDAVDVRGPDGRRIRLRCGGVRRTGDLLWIELRGSAPSGVRGGSIRSALMFDLFEDQVNIVQTNLGGSRRSLLFVPGDGAKRLR